jgi:hypothetical protein
MKKKLYDYDIFNTVLRRHVAWIRSSLLVKIQWRKHHYISEHRCGPNLPKI